LKPTISPKYEFPHPIVDPIPASTLVPFQMLQNHSKEREREREREIHPKL
jgi:hypothetical protein